MDVKVFPRPLRGQITVPPSKSHVHRLLIAAALCDGGQETRILCPGENDDIAATIRCLRALGTWITREGPWIHVDGNASLFSASSEQALDCGESGTTLRFLLPLCAALSGCRVTMTGAGRLPSRPNAPLLVALRAHGAKIQGDYLPLTVEGGLAPGAYSLPGDVSSQYFSGLLFVLPLLRGDSTLTFASPLESRPYVDLTCSVLKRFGIFAELLNNGWRISGCQRYASPGSAAAEGDWSAAAFWLGANALGSAVQVDGLNESSCQGDRAIDTLLQGIGDAIDVHQTPDLMPILAAAAAATPGKTTRILGASRLRLKESDRLAAMAQTIRALGGSVEEEADGLLIFGKRLRGGTVNGQNDHRVVMSAAIAATVCQEPVLILGADAVHKSYPLFWEDFAALGGRIHV